MPHRGLRASILVACFLAAAGAGYWVSASLGAETLRREAEAQLSDLLKGSVHIGRARLALRGGLFLEGERVGVYPRAAVPHRPALFAARVSAELDVLALLTGRFRLSGLLLDDAVLEIRRHADGTWSPPPFAWLAGEGRRAGATGDLERSLDWAGGLEDVTRTLLERPIVARRVEIRRSRITFNDERVRDGGDPIALGLYGVEGRLVHDWLSGDADLVLRATAVDTGGRTVAVSAEGWQRGGEAMRLAVAASDLPLSVPGTYLDGAGDGTDVAGRFSGEIAYETERRAHGTVTVQGTVDDFATTLTTRGGPIRMARPSVRVDATLELHPGRARLAAARLGADGVTIGLSGSAERPLGPAARARLDISVDGLHLDEVRRIADSLPDPDSETLRALLERLDTGRIERIGARGTARIDEWGPLLLGEAERLPRGFVLSAAVEDVRIRAGRSAVLSDLGGVIEVSGDRLGLRDATGRWNGEPLPRLGVSILGVSRLLRGEPVGEPADDGPAPLPGLGPLLAVIDEQREPASGDTEGRASPRVVLEIDRLAHPILRWPISDARVSIERTGAGAHLVFERGRWAGAPFDGDAVYMGGRAEELAVSVRVHAHDTGAEGASGPDTGTGDGRGWASGRVAVAPFTSGGQRVEDLSGRFALEGARLALRGLRARLPPGGRAEGALSLALDDPEAVGVGVELEIVDGDVGRLGGLIGLPDGYATGRMRLTGSLEGAVRPQTPLLTSLRGSARLQARDGEVRRDELPLVVALAQASKGYNEFAARDAIAYDSVDAGLVIAGGRITTQDFELDGPLRVYASGTLDVVRPPYEIVAVVGLFLFRGAGQIMETIPLVKAILPGSERGLMGAYFQITGPVTEPAVKALAGRSVSEQLPDVITAPYHLLRSILGRRSKSPPAAPEPPPVDAPPIAEPPP